MADEGVTCYGGKGWLYHPEFPDGWSRQSLHSLAQWVNGLAFRDIQFSPTGMPVIKIAEIKGGISDQTKRTQQTFDDSVRVKFGDLLFSWSGQPETSIDAFWWRGPEGWLNQHVFRVTPKGGIEPVFFFYLLRYLKPHFVGIARNKQTTGLGHVTKRDLESIEAAFPEEHEQRAIAHILGSLDDKIELNRRMNETLEAMARAMFKSWFVDFDPVRAKASGESHDSICRRLRLTPDLLALFPDRLVDSELGEIPEGWQVRALGAFSDLVTTSVSPSAQQAAVFEHYSIPAFDGGAMPTYDLGRTIKSNKYVVSPLAVLVSKLNPATPRVWMPVVKTARAVCSTEFMQFVPHRADDRPYLYLLMGSERMQSEIQQRVTGSTGSRQRAQPSQIVTLSIVVPSSRVLDAFSTIASPVLALVAESRIQSQGLGVTRDTLLPELMSGRLRVPLAGDA